MNNGNLKTINKNGRTANKRFGKSGGVARRNICANLKISRPSKQQ